MGRILVTKHRPSGAAGATDALRREIARSGAEIVVEAGGGFVVELPEEAFGRLDDEGFRWTELPEPGVLRVGDFTIDGGEPREDVPGELRVPEEEEARWTHRLVQLVAPPAPEWIAELQSQGVEIVETLGPYGLFVLADRRQARLVD